MIDLAAIKRRAEAATPGPWEYTDGNVWIDTRKQVCCGRPRILTNYEGDRLIGEECCGNPDIEGGQELIAQTGASDAEFIAHARQDIPDLITALSAAEAKVRELEAALRPFAQLAELFRGRAWMDDYVIEPYPGAKPNPIRITVGNLRTAAAAMQKEKEG